MRRAFVRNSLVRRLIFGFLVIAVLPLAGLAALNIHFFGQALTHTVVTSLAAIADKKVDQIDSFLNEIRLNARILGHSSEALGVFKHLQQAYPQGIDSDSYRKAATEAAQTLTRLSSELNYYDLLLINPEGDVVFSIKKEADFTSNLKTGAYRDTLLAEGFHNAMDYLTTEFSSFGLYAPSNNVPAAFVVTPFMQNGLPIGALALQINLEVYQPLVTDRTGLGETGETVLAQQTQNTAFFTTTLRYADNSAFNYPVPIGQLALPMQHALNGKRGQGVSVDYAGHAVVAAWRYLPSLHWGMVVKMDAAEALAPLGSLKLYSLCLLGVSMLFSAGFALILGRSIVTPLHHLIEASNAIAHGDFTQRAQLQRNDELGQLAYTFNHMASEVQQGQETLEQRVLARTRELNDAKIHAEQTLITLQETQASLSQAEKMAALGSLVAGIAHEINTPVGITLTSATYLNTQTKKTASLYQQGELDSDELETYFDIARQSSALMTINSQRAADLIQSFKQVAVDQTSGEKRQFDLKNYLSEILISLGPSFKKTAIAVQLDCPENITADTYPGALSQVLSNLIMNSLLHAYDAEQQGILSIRVQELPDNRIELVYSDDGKGIPLDIQSKIFDPFFTTRRGAGGSGLGLHIVYNVIHQTLKGSLQLSSDVGRGTVFTLRFPRELNA